MSTTRLVCGTLLAVFSLSQAHAQDPRTRLETLFRQSFEENLRDSPESATYLGRREYNGQWTDLSSDAIERRKQKRRERLQALHAIDRAKLDEASQLNYDLFNADLERRIEEDRFPGELLAVDPLFEGPQVRLPNTLAAMPARNAADYSNIVARLRGAARLVDQTIALLQQGVKQGVTPPAVILRDLPAQLDSLSAGNPASSPLLAAFRQFPDSMGEQDRDRLRREAAAAIDGSVFPAFQKLRRYLAESYLPACRASIARTALPNGAVWYALDVRKHTTTSLTPQQIHEIGLAEVKRIRAGMETVMRKTGFTGSFPEFLQFLRTDPRFYYVRAEDLLTGYRDICKRIDPELPKLFGKLPRMPYGVAPVPDHIAPSETTARYFPGAADGSRAGYFRANTFKLETRPKYEMEALSLHEAVPGHHIQIALAYEMKGVPEFRKSLRINAFTEGWGLYAESLGTELGFYRDPYSQFGQLSYEIWRACRLVVDTGMHALGWTRQQAIDYMKENTASTEQNIVVEVDRYLAWPGQALAYKIGELKIKELRKQAEKELGPKFDIRDFHDALLENGPLPMDVLEARMQKYIRERKP